MQRLKEFDALKLFTIYCVLLGHCILHLQNYQFEMADNRLYSFICSFHMPLFMMISGFFGSKIAGVKFKDFAFKRVRQLLLPAATFGLIFCISWFYIGGEQIVKNYFLCYWFLKSAFICALLYFLSVNSPKPNLVLILTLILSQFCFAYQVNRMYPSFVMGAFISRHYDWIKAKSTHLLIICGIIFLAMFAFWTPDMERVPLMRIHQFVGMESNEIFDITYTHFYRVIMGIAGSIMFISLFSVSAKYMLRSKIGDTLCKWGQYTLGIYLMQAIIIEHIMMKTLDFSSMNWYLFNLVVSPLLSVCVLLLCIGIIHLIHKSKRLSFIFLGEKRK